MGISGTDKALMFALGGVLRGGAGRFGYVSGRAFVSVAGVDVSDQVEKGELTVDDELNEVANSCQFRTETLIPERGDEVVITLGSKNRLKRLFAGHAIRPKTTYIERGAIGSEVNAVDYTKVRLHGYLVTAHYVGSTGTAILQALLETTGPGFSTIGVATDLAVIDEITFTETPLDDAISQVMSRLGGYWYQDYHGIVRAFVDDEANVSPPLDLTFDHPTLEEFAYDPDDSQVVTRAFVEGRGTKLLGPVDAGDTAIPLEAVDMFEGSGEIAKVSFQGSSGGAQHLAFTDVVQGGAGVFVGPGVTPTAAPLVTLNSGSGVDAGAHDYAFTWVTASGETTPSPVASITTGVLSSPLAAPGHYSDPSTWTTRYNVGTSLRYAVSHGYGFTATGTSGESALVAGSAYSVPAWSGAGSHPAVQHVTGHYSADPLVQYIHVWCSMDGADFLLLTTIFNIGGTGAWDVTDGFPALGSSPPTANPTVEQVSVSGVSVGPTGTTARNVYRTEAGGSQLKLVDTIADNTTTTYDDSTADSSLGADAPISDTSALTTTDGQVNPGETSIDVSGAGVFEASGGWALADGGQVIRYTGITGNTLTGVPASGTGAIAAPIDFGSTITACPMLTGIPASGTGSIATALSEGDEIYLVVQVDDLGAQSTMADRYTTAEYTDDGIRETWVQDRRLSITEARARGRAVLAQASNGILAITYTVRDPNTRTGLMVHVDLGAPVNVTGDFRIQRVSISEIATMASEDDVEAPLYTVLATNQRFSFEDLIRQNRGVI